MAYATKYRCEFKDRLNTTIQADILQDGFSGSITYVQAGIDPLSLSWPGDRENIFNPVRGAQATLNMIAATDGQFNEFFDANNKEYQLRIIVGGSEKWRGWLILSDYYESMNAAPYEVTVSAYDIGYLQEITWDKSRVADDSILDVIVHIMTQTGLSLEYFDEVNIYEDSITSGTINSMLTQINIHQAVFMDDSWNTITYYEALSRILLSFNAFIVQDAGYWKICRVADLAFEHNYRRYNSSGTYVANGTVDGRVLLSTLPELNRTGVMMSCPNYKYLRLSHNRGVGNLINNGLVPTTSATASDYWSITSGSGNFAYTTSIVYEGFPYIFVEKRNCLYMQLSFSRKQITHDITYFVAANTYFNFDYGYALYHQFGTASAATNVRIEVKLAGASTYYLNVATGAWSTTSTVSDITFSSTTIKSWSDVSLKTDKTPIDGTISISLTEANWTFTGRTYFTISLVPVNINSSTFASIGNYDLLIDTDSLEDQPDTTFYLGDPYDTDARDVLTGSLTLASTGAATDSWTPLNAGGRTDTLLNLARECYQAQFEKPARRIQSTLFGDLTYLSILKDSSDRCYLAGTLTREFGDNRFTGEWIEIKRGWQYNLLVNGSDFTNGDGGDEYYDTYDESGAPTLLLVKSQTTTEAKVTIEKYSEVGMRYKITTNLTESVPSDNPTLLWGGNATTIATGENTYEFVATSFEKGYIQSPAPDECDILVTISIQEVYGV